MGEYNLEAMGAILVDLRIGKAAILWPKGTLYELISPRAIWGRLIAEERLIEEGWQKCRNDLGEELWIKPEDD